MIIAALIGYGFSQCDPKIAIHSTIKEQSIQI